MSMLPCQIVRWVSDEPVPGLVAVEFADAHGHRRTIIDKEPMFTSTAMDCRTQLPLPGWIRCSVIGEADENGHVVIELTDIDVETDAITGPIVVRSEDLQRDTRTLWRPVGRNELALIEQASYRGFPPRLPEQPIFYPVLNFGYAEQIARDWNSKDARHANVGFVTEFEVLGEFLERYEAQQVGGRVHREYWIPAAELPAFNDAIVGGIQVIAEYRHGERVR